MHTACAGTKACGTRLCFICKEDAIGPLQAPSMCTTKRAIDMGFAIAGNGDPTAAQENKKFSIGKLWVIQHLKRIVP